MLDSVIRVNKKYYSQTLLEECKYETKKNKMGILSMMISTQVHLMNRVNKSDNESDNDSDNESYKESKKPSKKPLKAF